MAILKAPLIALAGLFLLAAITFSPKPPISAQLGQLSVAVSPDPQATTESLQAPSATPQSILQPTTYQLQAIPPAPTRSQLLAVIQDLFRQGLSSDILAQLTGPKGDRGDAGLPGIQGPSGFSIGAVYPTATNQNAGTIGGVTFFGAKELTSQTLTVSGASTLSSLTAGTTTLGDTTLASLTVSGSSVWSAASISSNLDVSGTVSANDIITKGPTIDVRAYGAKGDGVTDDTVAIQDAITAAAAVTLVTGRHPDIFFPNGNYYSSTGIVVTGVNNLTIRGQGVILVKSDVEAWKWDNSRDWQWYGLGLATTVETTKAAMRITNGSIGYYAESFRVEYGGAHFKYGVLADGSYIGNWVTPYMSQFVVSDTGMWFKDGSGIGTYPPAAISIHSPNIGAGVTGVLFEDATGSEIIGGTIEDTSSTKNVWIKNSTNILVQRVHLEVPVTASSNVYIETSSGVTVDTIQRNAQITLRTAHRNQLRNITPSADYDIDIASLDNVIIGGLLNTNPAGGLANEKGTRTLILGMTNADGGGIFVQRTNGAQTLNILPTSLTMSGGATVSDSSGQLTLAAGGSNASVVLTPVGSGYIRLDGGLYSINGSGGANWLTTTTQSQIGTYTNHPFYLKANDTTAITILGSGNVGIGTTSPTSALHIVGNTATLFNVASGSNSRFVVLENGNVGISTTTPDSKLDVAGNILASSSGNIDFTMKSTSNQDAVYTLRALSTGNFAILGSVSNTLVTIASSGRIFTGTNAPGSDNTSYLIGRALTGAGISAHAIRDESTVNASTDDASYASFDAAPTISGSSVYNHVAGIQARQSYNGSGTLGEWRGFYANPAHSGTGTITNVKEVYLTDPASTGTITNVYGVFVDALTRGSSSNYAIYTMPTTPSWFSGRVNIGFNSATTGTATTDGHLAIQGLSGNQRFELGYNTTSDYGWMQAAKYGTAYEPIVMNANGGNVGIGDSSPEQKLTVTGNIIASTSGVVDLTLNNTAATYGKFILRSMATPAAGRLDIIGGAAGATTLISIASTGFVGIGTTTPTSRLSVVGSIRTVQDSNAALILEDRTTAGVQWTLYSDTSSLRFYKGGDKVVIDTIGNIGIGTTTPTAKLAVSGTASISGQTLIWNSASVSANLEVSGYASTSKLFGKSWTTATGTPSSICQNATTGEITINAALTCTVSARDQKESITTLNISALPLLMALRPSQFAYIDNPVRLRWGFIADEVQAVDPKLGDAYDLNGTARSIDLPALIALNTKAIQELASRAFLLDELLAPRSSQLEPSSGPLARLVQNVLAYIADTFGFIIEKGRIQSDTVCIGAECIDEQELQQIRQLIHSRTAEPTPTPAVETPTPDPTPTDTPVETSTPSDTPSPVVDSSPSIDPSPVIVPVP